jgi:hypothetical protein
MGFMDSIGSFFSGGADKAALQAAQQQAGGYDAARGVINTGETNALAALTRNLSPYAEAGTASTREQQALLGLLGPDEAAAARARFQTSPGYSFQFDEGQRGLERGTAARGGLYSGSAGKALTRFGQGLASTEYGNHFSRLGQLGTTGYNASSTLGTGSANTITGAAGQRADALLGRSNALAGGTINAANARAQGIGNALSLIGKVAGSAIGGGFGMPGGDVGLGSWGATVMRG